MTSVIFSDDQRDIQSPESKETVEISNNLIGLLTVRKGDNELSLRLYKNDFAKGVFRGSLYCVTQKQNR